SGSTGASQRRPRMDAAPRANGTLYAPSRGDPVGPRRYSSLGKGAMPTAIALIRGINVGSTRSLPMQLLRDLCEEVGMRDARTHIQSGNVVFRAAGRGLTPLATKLELAIEKRCGFRPSVVVRTPAQIGTAIEANPFPRRAKLEPNKLLVMFLQKDP